MTGENLTFDEQHKLDKDIRNFVDSWRYHGPMDNYQLEKMIYFDDKDEDKFKRIFDEYKELIDGLFEQFRKEKNISELQLVASRKKLLNRHDNFYNLDQPEHFEKFKQLMIQRAAHYRIKRIHAKKSKDGKLVTPNVAKSSVNRYPYEEIKAIGKGGFGEVWIVKDESGKKYIAKKVHCRKLEYRTLCEWSELLYLRHDNIVNGEECFFDPDNAMMIIIMEYCQFGDIGHLI